MRLKHKERVLFFLPFSVSISLYIVMFLTLLIYVKRGVFEVNHIIVLLIIVCAITYRKVYELCDSEFVTSSKILFFKFMSNSIVFDSLDEIFIIEDIRSQEVQRYSTHSSSIDFITNKNIKLLIKTENNEYMQMFSSIKREKVENVADMFSKYFQRPVKCKYTHPDERSD